MKIKKLGSMAVVSCLLLSGCFQAPWAGLVLKHDAKVQAAASAAQLAKTTQLQASFDTYKESSESLIDNLQDTISQQEVVKQQEDTDVNAIYTISYDKSIEDQAKVIAIQVYATYAKKLTKPQTAEEAAATLVLIEGLESQNLKDRAASEAQIASEHQKAEAALAQDQIDQGKNAQLTQTYNTAENSLNGVTGAWKEAQSKLSKALGDTKVALGKYSALKALGNTILEIFYIVVGIGVILGILSLIPATEPFAYPLSKAYRLAITWAFKVILLPIHAIYDILVAIFKKKLAAATPTPTTTVIHTA